MRKHFLTAVALLVLGGCQTVNHSPGSAQFNFETEAFPERHREIAADIVGGRPVVGNGGLLISEPNTMTGENAFSPMRWYVCVRGIAPPRRPQAPVTLGRKLSDILDPPLVADTYDVIIIFRETGHRQVVTGFDSRLCRNAKFEIL